MSATIMRLLCILLLIFLSFVLGVSLNLNQRPINVIEGAKQTASNVMYQPQAADFKDVKLHAPIKLAHKNSVGNICGKILTFKDDIPYKYKRFIVEAATNKAGECVFSFPIFDFEGEIIPEADFQKIWEQRCSE